MILKTELMKAEMNVNDNLVSIIRIKDIDYISLTDLA